jgi:hypothetical protein
MAKNDGKWAMRRQPLTRAGRARHCVGAVLLGRLRPLSKALEKTYDGIIIGAGHCGLILGSDLDGGGVTGS